jgi:hypothetical protein
MVDRKTLLKQHVDKGKYMNIYEVSFGHKRWGSNWSVENIAVKGFVLAAISKAMRLKKNSKQLYITSVELLAEGK